MDGNKKTEEEGSKVWGGDRLPTAAVSPPLCLPTTRPNERREKEGEHTAEDDEGGDVGLTGRRRKKKEESAHTVEGTVAASPSLCLPTRFVHEDSLGGFAPALAFVMAGWKKEGGEGGREGGEEEEEEEGEGEEACVMWLVDDLLFHAPFDATPFLALLSSKRGKGGGEGGKEEEEEEVWAIHPKLHPGISYSHTLDKVREGGREGGGDNDNPAASSHPSLHLSLPTQALHPPRLLFHPSLGTTGFLFKREEKKNDDWHYPWDLCGSIYRLQGKPSLPSFQARRDEEER